MQRILFYEIDISQLSMGILIYVVLTTRLPGMS